MNHSCIRKTDIVGRSFSPVSLGLMVVLAFFLAGCRASVTSPVVAIVNGTPITLGELQRTPEFYDFLDEYIASRMMQAAADTQMISPTRENVERAEREEIQKRFAGDRESFENWLAQRGLTRDDFRRYVLRNLQREMLIAKHLEPSEEELKQAFRANKEGWRDYYAGILQVPREQVTDEYILQNLKKDLMYLRGRNLAEREKIIETYRGWATKVIYPNSRHPESPQRSRAHSGEDDRKDPGTDTGS